MEKKEENFPFSVYTQRITNFEEENLNCVIELLLHKFAFSLYDEVISVTSLSCNLFLVWHAKEANEQIYSKTKSFSFTINRLKIENFQCALVVPAYIFQ